jgi:hypothetical protein
VWPWTHRRLDPVRLSQGWLRPGRPARARPDATSGIGRDAHAGGRGSCIPRYRDCGKRAARYRGIACHRQGGFGETAGRRLIGWAAGQATTELTSGRFDKIVHQRCHREGRGHHHRRHDPNKSRPISIGTTTAGIDRLNQWHAESEACFFGG